MSKKENVRNREIKNLLLMVIITFFVGLIIIVFYLTRDNKQFITYNEESNVDYKVYLKDNDFYKEKYLGKDKSYIASLIKNIYTEFNYNVDISNIINYDYSYRIAAEVDVLDEKTGTNIYHFSENLKEVDSKVGSGNLAIKASTDINYGDYNNKISKFMDVYELKNASANLNIYLYVTIDNIDNIDVSSLKDKKVSSISIPLTENTISVDIGDTSIANTNNKVEIVNVVDYSWLFILGLLFILISIIYLVYLIMYCSKTRTAQMIYEKEIKSIMNNYDYYIQKISGSYDIGTSQVIKIESFNDMLEIRDTLKQPILMLENERRDGTFFIIPATNSIIYTYALRVVDITAKMEGKEIPTYDITEIPHADFKKNKKYTDKYIKEQITMTTSMPVVDEKNIIKGKNDKKIDLYEQLEKTTSFDLNEIRKAAKSKKNSKVTTKKTTAKKSTTKKSTAKNDN